MSENTVELYIYDLSGGMAAVVSPMLLGIKQISVYTILRLCYIFTLQARKSTVFGIPQLWCMVGNTFSVLEALRVAIR